MNDLTPEQRARALGVYRAYMSGVGHPVVTEHLTLSDMEARAWLAAGDHVLASHACPDVESDPRVRAWNIIAKHPFFKVCYSAEGTLTDAMLAKLDAAHSHVCEPVWRPVAFDEIQAGWEVRSRHRSGFEMNWGTAHHRDGDGSWRTAAGAMVTLNSPDWTYETTAPAVAPKPKHYRDASTGETVPTRHETPDVAELRRLAEACPMPDNDPDVLSEWYEFEDLTEHNYPIPPIDAAFIAAASPDVVLGLLGRLAHMTEARDNARAEVERLTAKVEAVREWIDRRGVDVSDRDDDYMNGYRAAQRHALLDAVELRRALDGGSES